MSSRSFDPNAPLLRAPFGPYSPVPSYYTAPAGFPSASIAQAEAARATAVPVMPVPVQPQPGSPPSTLEVAAHPDLGVGVRVTGSGAGVALAALAVGTMFGVVVGAVATAKIMSSSTKKPRRSRTRH